MERKYLDECSTGELIEELLTRGDPVVISGQWMNEDGEPSPPRFHRRGLLVACRGLSEEMTEDIRDRARYERATGRAL